MPGLYVADFTSVAPMGAQSPAASISKPADPAFGEALHQATRPEPKVTRQTRTEAAPRQSPRQAAGEQGQQISTSEPTPGHNIEAASASGPEVARNKESGEESQMTAAESMAPFYMAALFDQSASYLQPSAQSERVAAAERVQQFVADWLQTQATENNPVSTTAPTNQAESTEVVSMALDILNQFVEDSLGSATTPEENLLSQDAPDKLLAAAPVNGQQSQPLKVQLNDHNAAELRQLMAVMMQSGRIPEPFNQQPENNQLQQQLDRILPLVISVSSAAAQATTERSAREQVVAQTIPVEDLDSPAAQATTERSAQTRAVNQTIPMEVQMSAEAHQVRAAGRKNAQTPENFSPARLTLDSVDESRSSVQQPLSDTLTDTKTGLQESQMAKIFAAASAHPQSEEKTSEPSFARPTAGHSEESAAAGQAETSKVEFAMPQQQRADTAVHMVANGPLATQNLAHGDATPVKLMQLPSGQQLPETRLVDQVVSHLAAGNNGESSRMLLRLNPAELGTLRIELTMEGDKLRAQLHAQTQQVQEVLDRHLPQLRDALQMQGLKIDSFRVDVQGGQSQARDQASQWQQPQHQGQPGHQPTVTDWPPPELDIPLQQILQQPAGSISLRV